MSNSYDPIARCMCGHLQIEHDDNGCIICSAHNQSCSSFWTQEEYDDAVNHSLLDTLKAIKEQKEKQK